MATIAAPQAQSVKLSGVMVTDTGGRAGWTTSAMPAFDGVLQDVDQVSPLAGQDDLAAGR